MRISDWSSDVCSSDLASTCASGSQVWTGHIGILTANDAKNASHSHVCAPTGKSWPISVGMSVVHAWFTIHSIAISISTAEQRIEEELVAGVDAPRAAPDADDVLNRDEAGHEEDEEE